MLQKTRYPNFKAFFIPGRTVGFYSYYRYWQWKDRLKNKIYETYCTNRDLARVKGRVKWFNEEKGFGFVTPLSEPGQDVFVRASQLPKKEPIRILFEGDEVEFDIEQKRKGFSKNTSLKNTTTQATLLFLDNLGPVAKNLTIVRRALPERVMTSLAADVIQRQHKTARKNVHIKSEKDK
jgi:CspA family cold shock protein